MRRRDPFQGQAALKRLYYRKLHDLIDRGIARMDEWRWSQRDLARESGLSNYTISAWQRHLVRFPRFDSLVKFAACCELRIDLDFSELLRIVRKAS